MKEVRKFWCVEHNSTHFSEQLRLVVTMQLYYQTFVLILFMDIIIKILIYSYLLWHHVFFEALCQVGIIPLIDEATGYQNLRVNGELVSLFNKMVDKKQ